MKKNLLMIMGVLSSMFACGEGTPTEKYYADLRFTDQTALFTCRVNGAIPEEGPPTYRSIRRSKEEFWAIETYRNLDIKALANQYCKEKHHQSATAQGTP